jgi:hypothetical protein
MRQVQRCQIKLFELHFHIRLVVISIEINLKIISHGNAYNNLEIRIISVYSTLLRIYLIKMIIECHTCMVFYVCVPLGSFKKTSLIKTTNITVTPPFSHTSSWRDN